MSILNEVLITISGEKTGDIYKSRSYPDDDFNNDGIEERYQTPVYKVFIEGKVTAQNKVWPALRFMPYWNDPKKLKTSYKTSGWVNSGLSAGIAKKAVTYYDPKYGTHNRYSAYSGAIQIKDSFLIHAGPTNLTDDGWGAAGCIEIIGNFDEFKDDIKKASGTTETDSHAAIAELVKAGKLFVQVDYAERPDLHNYGGN